MTRPRSRTRRRLLPIVALAALLGAGAATPAHAASSLTLAMTDHGPAFDGDATQVDRAMARARSIGVRAMRIYVGWDAVASGGSRPANASNPGDPAYRWGGIDRWVRSALNHGMEPILSLADTPRWAERGGGGPAGTNNPDPTAYGEFAYAAASRYSGSYSGLPRVRYFQAWNEPNFDGFFSPVSPDLYRGIVNAMANAVKSVHDDNLVVAGGLASFLKPGHSVAPMEYMRQLLCMSGGPRPTSVCNQSIRFDIWSMHPYTVGNAFHKAAGGGGVSMGDLPAMNTLLRAAARAGQIRSNGTVGFWITEFGWDSNPPDPQGTPMGQLMRQVPEALYQAWRSGVSLLTWYNLVDDPMSDAPYQSGMFFACSGGFGCDTAKPIVSAWRFPFVAYRRGRRAVYVWGKTPDGQPGRVSVDQRVRGGFRRLAWVRTNANGLFSRTIRTRSGAPLRAAFAFQSSPEFALGRTPDTPYPVFGTP